MSEYDCAHCHDDPPKGHTCPACGRTAPTAAAIAAAQTPAGGWTKAQLAARPLDTPHDLA